MNTFVVTGRSNLAVKKATIRSEGEGDSNFIVYLTTDEFPPEMGSSLVVKVKDKTFVPHSCGGDSRAYWSLELQYIDRASAEILNGGPLPRPPKESLTMDVKPHQEVYLPNTPVKATLVLINIDSAPLTVYWGTLGDGQFRCRDTQLSFKAMLDNAEAEVLEDNITYGKAGDTELKLDLARPEGDGPFPAIVFIHGGGWYQGNRQSYRSEIQEVASRGYVAVTISYRLMQFDMAKKEATTATPVFPAQIHDAKAATRARVTQIMNLLMLAPDIQEAILFLPRVEHGRDPIHLPQVQSIALTPDWRKQRQMWTALAAAASRESSESIVEVAVR